MPRLLPVLTAAALLHPGLALAQTEPSSTAPATNSRAPGPAPATPAPPVNSTATPSSGRPTPAQQAVLERIRRLRDGGQRRFGNCSYRWDGWKLQADGSRTTSYSCEGSSIVDHTIGVNCSKLQINSFNPNAERSGSSERGSWGSWRLPEPGGEEQMVATLCANALPVPEAAPAASGTSAPAARAATKTAPPTGTAPATGR